MSAGTAKDFSLGIVSAFAVRASAIRSAPRRPLMQCGGNLFLEFGIVWRMRVTAGDQRSVSALGGVNEARDIRDDVFGTGNIERAAGDHEIDLRVHLP